MRKDAFIQLRMLSLLILAASSWLSPSEASASSTQRERDQQEFFRLEVRPILETHCYSCHGGGKAKGGLDLTTRQGLLIGGDLGPAIDEQNPGASLLVEAVRYLGPEMPPKGRLPENQIATLVKWVEMGAPWDIDTDPTPKLSAERRLILTEDHRNHWAFQPVKQPPVPEVKNTQWVRNPIDRFILRKIEDARLSPAPEADRASLLRRLHYDLTGLPPTPEQVKAFESDQRADAYERRIDALLASPQYGERWARHWLDVVRYAESNSFERDKAKPFVWRYRDYVVNSLNADIPYDQFVLEQLAGDELGTVTPESIIATGFYRLGPWDDEPTDRQQARYDELDDILTTTSQTFLGLTINCARCHDHKIDPIPQRDYYRLLAFLHNVKPYSYDENHILTDVATPEQWNAHKTETAVRDRKAVEILNALRPIEEKLLEQVPEPRRSRLRSQSDFRSRKHVYDDLVARFLGAEDFKNYQELVGQLESLPEVAPLPKALCVKEYGAARPETFVLIRGAAASKGERVEPGFPEVLAVPDPVLPSLDPGAASSGSRLVLARWIASPSNPLTARVMANRVWQHHFGRGIVRTPNDFGIQGDKPTHPELLDWLAAEFINRGWRLKELHRLILTSSAYRMSSRAEPQALEIDPRNDLIWRFNLRRLSAEEIRDSILEISGRLNPEMAGPSIFPPIPPAYLAGQSRPGEGWGNSSESQQVRRSLYIHIKRSLVTPILASFDAADTDFTCPVRFATTQPTQALSTLNGTFLNEEARFLAERLRREVGPNTVEQVRRGLSLATGREPTPLDVERGKAFLSQIVDAEGISPERALELYCLILLNLNEFIYVD